MSAVKSVRPPTSPAYARGTNRRGSRRRDIGGSCRFVTRPYPGSAPGSAPAVPVLAVALTLDLGVEPELREGVEVRAVPVLGVRRQVRAHASFDLGRKRKVEVAIDPPHHGERVIHQL